MCLIVLVTWFPFWGWSPQALAETATVDRERRERLEVEADVTAERNRVRKEACLFFNNLNKGFSKFKQVLIVHTLFIFCCFSDGVVQRSSDIFSGR